MMLLPDGHGFTSSQLSSEDHDVACAFDPITIQEEQQYHLTKGWAYCLFPGYWCAFASPRIIQLYLFFMQGEILFLAINGKHIVALGMNQYLVKAFFFEYLNQVIRAIPTVEGDRESSQVNAFLMEHLHQLVDHLSENLGFGCVTPALFAYRSVAFALRYNPFTYLDGYGYDVLAPHCIMVSSTEPAIRKTYEFAHSIYDSIINTDGDPLSGLGCWTFGKNFGYKFLSLRQPSIQEQLPQMIYAPGVDGAIDVVLVKVKNLYELIRREYVEHMSVSQHEHNLHRFLVTSWEVSVKKLLKLLSAFVNLIYHICLLMILVAFSLNTPIRRLYFSFIVKGLYAFFLTHKEFSVTKQEKGIPYI